MHWHEANDAVSGRRCKAHGWDTTYYDEIWKCSHLRLPLSLPFHWAIRKKKSSHTSSLSQSSSTVMFLCGILLLFNSFPSPTEHKGRKKIFSNMSARWELSPRTKQIPARSCLERMPGVCCLVPLLWEGDGRIYLPYFVGRLHHTHFIQRDYGELPRCLWNSHPTFLTRLLRKTMTRSCRSFQTASPEGHFPASLCRCHSHKIRFCLTEGVRKFHSLDSTKAFAAVTYLWPTFSLLGLTH